MSRTIRTIIDELAVFVPDESESNAQALNQILDGIQQMPDRHAGIPSMFEFMEQFSEVDLGSPGPIVHELEDIDGYEPLLAKSLARKPTLLTTWMANRILNSKLVLAKREFWRTALSMGTTHPVASIEIIESAHSFIDHNLGRSDV